MPSTTFLDEFPIGRYERQEKLGEGAFGTVFRYRIRKNLFGIAWKVWEMFARKLLTFMTLGLLGMYTLSSAVYKA